MTINNLNFGRVIVENGIKYGDKVAVMAPKKSKPNTWNKFTWSQYAQFVALLIEKWSTKYTHILKRNMSTKPPVAGVYVSSIEDSITSYFVLSSIGFTMITVPSYFPEEHKLTICKDNNIELIITDESCKEGWIDLYKEHLPSLEVYSLDSKTETLAENNKNEVNLTDALNKTATLSTPKPLLILTSSASTGLPKSFPWNNIEGLLGAGPQLLGDSISGKMVVANYPLFAIGNVMRILTWLIKCPQNMLFLTTYSSQFNKKINVEIFVQLGRQVVTMTLLVYQVTTLIDHIWNAENTQKQKLIEHMRSIDGLGCGGGWVDNDTIIKAIKLGIKIKNVYGVSEGAVLMSNDQELTDEVWDSTNGDITEEILEKASLLVPLTTCCKITFEKVEGLLIKGEDVYELVLDAKDPLFSNPLIANDGTNWRSGDLFRKKTVQTRSNRAIEGYLYCGRGNDLIILENGIKVLLSLLESALTKHITEAGFNNVHLIFVGKSMESLVLLVKDFSGRDLQPLQDAFPVIFTQYAKKNLPKEFTFKLRMVYYLSDSQNLVYSAKKLIPRELNRKFFEQEIKNLQVSADE